MKLTFLGTGTSQGVPVIACSCAVCHSADPHDRHLRTSALVETDAGENILIDIGPDFREQMLREHVMHLEGILITHAHRDHVGGIDDIRSFNYVQDRKMDIWCNEPALKAIVRDYHYIFDYHEFPGLPEADMHLVDGSEPFAVGSVTVVPIRAMHKDLPVLGYRIGPLAYVTDANYIAPEEMDKMRGVDTLVINALRKEKHFSHFCLEEALEVIRQVSPREAYITHVSHQMGFYAEVSKELPPHVHLAYDGLKINVAAPLPLHLVSFNVPFPADYGGVIDVYHRLRALSEAGFRVRLHSYTYGRAAAPQLEEICEAVHYYPRETGLRHQFERRPYIAASRCSRALLDRLRQDDHPILLEGLHDCWLLEQLADGHRKIFVRAHNVEHDYYNALADAAPLGWKRLFYRVEAGKLRRYEAVLTKATAVFAISETDAEHFRQLGCRQVFLLPPAHGHSRVLSQTGRGGYALYHGNLSVPENRHAVEYLLDNIFFDAPCDLVVAGRDPDADLRQRIAAMPRVRLVANPDDMQMKALLRDAQVNILYTDQGTGVKLKLLNALYEGRHCLVNSTMVAGTDLAEACAVADSPESMRQQLAQLMEADFTADDLARRQRLLAAHADLPADILRLLAE